MRASPMRVGHTTAEGEQGIARYDLRTEEHCKNMYKKYEDMIANGASKKECNAFLTDNSFHPVPSGLWGFCEGDQDEGSASWAFAGDSMHNEDLGVFLYIIKNMKVKQNCFIFYFVVDSLNS